MAKRYLQIGIAGVITALFLTGPALAEKARSMVCAGPHGRYEVRYLPDDKVLFFDNKEFRSVVPPTPGVDTYIVGVMIDAEPVLVMFRPQPSVTYHSTDGLKTLRRDQCRVAPQVAHASESPHELTLQEIQSLLNDLGFDAGPADGVAGRRTREAIAAFQRSIGAPATGHLTLQQGARLVKLASEKTSVPSEHVAPSGNRPPTGGAPKKEATRAPAGIRFFKDCEHCPEMAALPKGSFMMGATQYDKKVPFIQYSIPHELPQHKVTIDYGFAIGRFEVTVDEFDRYVQETHAVVGGNCSIRLTERGPRARKYKGTLNPDTNKLSLGPYMVIITDGSYRQPGLPVTGRQPATCISRAEAEGYLRWLSQKTGRRYRLPTEAEWEYAARANTDTVAFWGNNLSQACAYANFADRVSGYQAGVAAPCAESIRPEWTADVGSYKPNPWGLYDMLGNVNEMLEDCYQGTYKDAPADGSALTKANCTLFVARGGDYENLYTSMRTAERYFYSYDPKTPNGGRANLIGFRVAVTLSGAASGSSAVPPKAAAQPNSEPAKNASESHKAPSGNSAQTSLSVQTRGEKWQALSMARHFTGDIVLSKDKMIFGNGEALPLHFVAERMGYWAMQGDKLINLPGKIYKLDPKDCPKLPSGDSWCDSHITYLVLAQPAADHLVLNAFVGKGVPFSPGVNLLAIFNFKR